MIRSWSTTQAVTALSSGEAEYYALVKAGSQSIGIKRMMQDLGHIREDLIEIKTDASAAIGIASRIGIGKTRHIGVNTLWLQEKVFSGDIVLTKVGSEENLADALTKAVAWEALKAHVRGSGGWSDRSRHTLAPKAEIEDSWEGEEEDEEEW